jgi:predicted nucleic-acid-binding protein
VLEQAELIAIPLPRLCEFVWVLRRVYAFSKRVCITAIEALMASKQVVIDAPGVKAMLESGGNFADGVMAHSGHWLGGYVFVTFDRKAAALLEAHGVRTHLL